MNKQTRLSVFNVWLLIPAVPFYAEVLLNARNIPHEDDYDAVLGWIIKWKYAEGWDKLWLLFSQHNEHRIFHSRIIYLLQYFIEGGVNFRSLIIIGDLQLLAIGILCCYFIFKYIPKYKKIVAAIWMLILFDGNTYEAADWAMASIQNYGIIMLFLLSLFFYDRKLWWLGAVIQCIMIFSSGSGLLGSLIISAFTFSKSKKSFFVSAGVTLIFGPLYFLNYQQPEIPIPGQFPIDSNKAIDFFIQQAGAHLSFTYSFVCGIVVLGGILWAFPWRSSCKINTLMCIAVFVIGSMGTIAIFRGSTVGAQFQTSRYLIYPEMLTAILIAFWAVKLQLHKRLLPISIGVLVFSIWIYSVNYKYGKAGFERIAARCDYYRYWYPWNKAHADSIAVKACDMGIYCIEDNR